MKIKIESHERYGKCRVGEGWIVAADVARILGYVKGTTFANKHVAKEDKRYEMVRALKSTNVAKTLLINKAGVESMIDASANVDAEEIKGWVLSIMEQEPPVQEPVSQNLPQVLIPQLFNHPQFGNLRIVVINNEVWFVGKDVATSLGYKDTDQALRQHVDERDKLTRQINGAGQRRTVTLINKSGVYSLILDSQLPKAKDYRHWVTADVLPQVDEKGYYVADAAPAQNDNLLQAQINTLKAENALLRNQLPTLSSLAMAVVYVLLLSNGSIKIGVTDCLPRRIKEIELETNLRVLNFKSTPYLLRNEAENLEAFLKDKFSEQVLTGEFFSARFDEVAALIS